VQSNSRPARRHDLAALLLEEVQLVERRLRAAVRPGPVIHLLPDDLLCDAFELLPARVAGDEMALDVVEQARHLADQVPDRRDVQQVRLGGVEVSQSPLDQRPSGTEGPS